MRLLLVGLFLLQPFMACAGSLAEYSLMRHSMRTPEGVPIRLREIDEVPGRVHLNDQLQVTPGSYPTFHGYFTQTPEYVINLPEELYDQVFRGGYQFPVPEVDFPDPDALLKQLSNTAPIHSYPSLGDQLEPLTTSIRFDHDVYHVAQYSPSQINGLDTMYTMDWRTRSIPQETGLIRIRGVTRLQGIVEGRATVVSEDTLFITGDLVVADALLEDCSDTQTFGSVPPGSPNRIGLIGMTSVLIAATRANGLGGPGAFSCPSPYPPVLTSCGQGNQDIVLTAAILAPGCSFGVEYWKTTATQETFPPDIPQQFCGGMSYTHVELFDCNTEPLTDSRGTIWFCGSLVSRYYGVKRRSHWDGAIIGYDYLEHKIDANLGIFPPPFWPQQDVLGPRQPGFTWSSAAATQCGVVEDMELFRSQWNWGSIHLDALVSWPTQDFERQVTFRTLMNGLVVDEASALLIENESYRYTPQVPFQEYVTQFRIEAEWAYGTWNEGGERCRWILPLTEVKEPAQGGPDTLELQAAPNPFNPATRIRFTLPRAGRVQLDVYNLQGQLVRRLQEGELEAGEHAVIFDGSGLAGGIHICRLTTREGVASSKLLYLP